MTYIPASAYLKRWDNAEFTMEAYEDKWDGYTPGMSPDDHALARLREAYPGWRIWHVPAVYGGGTWCAQPLPLINVGSPDELMRAIEAAQPDSKPFDPEGDTWIPDKGSQGS